VCRKTLSLLVVVVLRPIHLFILFLYIPTPYIGPPPGCQTGKSARRKALTAHRRRSEADLGLALRALRRWRPGGEDAKRAGDSANCSVPPPACRRPRSAAARPAHPLSTARSQTPAGCVNSRSLRMVPDVQQHWHEQHNTCALLSRPATARDACNSPGAHSGASGDQHVRSGTPIHPTY
jgi:hypothetical protein